MLRRILPIFLLVVFLLAPAAGADNWWEEEASASPLESTNKGADYAAMINWGDGYIEAVGEASCDPSLAVNQSHCYTMALKAARSLAYEKLAETIHGVYISSSNTFEDEVIKNTRLNTAVQGLITNARIISEEPTTMQDGSLLVRVRLGLLINGPKGLSQAVITHIPVAESSPQILKLHADLQRTQAEMEEAKTRADRFEQLVEQALQSAEEAKQVISTGSDHAEVQQALQQAAAASRMATEAKELAQALAETAAKAADQGREIQTQYPSSAELEEVVRATQEARDMARRLEQAAEDAKKAAQDARDAGETASARSNELVEALDVTKRLQSEVEEARQLADGARRKTEEALSSLLGANAQVTQGSPAAEASLEEAQRAFAEAKAARGEISELSSELREARLAIDSLSIRGSFSNQEVIQRLLQENSRISTELVETRQRQQALQQQGAAALAEVATAVEQLSATERTEEVQTSIEELRQSLEEVKILQQQVASLEERTAAAETQARQSQAVALTSSSDSNELNQATREATAAASLVRTLIDSLRAVDRGARSLAQGAHLTSANVSESVGRDFTGLILDASYLGARAALKPRIFSQDGEEVYGERTASREVALSKGYASWSDSPETARDKAKKRIGSNPLVVRAMEATGKHRSDLVVSREDAMLIERADQKTGFLKQCKVAITILPQA